MSIKRRLDDLRKRAAGAAAEVASAASGGRVGGKRDDAAPPITVAAFGKHPGWRDHMEGVGLSTAALVEFKRLLYSDGIYTLSSSGVWGEANADALLKSFDHWVLSRRGSDVILARMTPTRDGVGREVFPFIVCIHASRLPQSWMFAHLPAALERIERDCAAAGSAAEVRAIIEAAQRELEGQAAGVASGAADDAARDEEFASGSSSGALGRIAGRLGDDRTPLHRVLYVIEREMTAYMPLPPGSSSTSSRDTIVRPRHVRVPVARDKAADGSQGSAHERHCSAMRDWLDAMLALLAPTAPILLLAPANHDWIDIIVGDATEHQLKCLRLLPKAIPLASDIPYEMDAAFAERAEKVIGAARDGTSSGQVLSEAAGNGEGATSRDHDHDRASRKPAGGAAAAPFRLASPLVMSLAAVVVVGATIVMLVLSRGGAPPSPIAFDPIDSDAAAGRAQDDRVTSGALSNAPRSAIEEEAAEEAAQAPPEAEPHVHGEEKADDRAVHVEPAPATFEHDALDDAPPEHDTSDDAPPEHAAMDEVPLPTAADAAIAACAAELDEFLSKPRPWRHGGVALAWDGRAEALRRVVAAEPARCAELSDQAERIAALLEECDDWASDAGFSVSAFGLEGHPATGRELKLAIEHRREEGLRSALTLLEAEGVDRAHDEFAAAKAAHAQWLQQASTFLRDFAQIESRLDAAYGLDDRGTDDDGRTVRGIHDEWRDRSIRDDLADIEFVRLVAERIEGLAALPAEREALLAIVQDVSEPPERRVEAWRRLGGVQNVGEAGVHALLEDERNCLRYMRDILSSLNEERAAVLSAELDHESRRRWLAAAAIARTDADLGHIVHGAHFYGIHVDADGTAHMAEIPPYVEFNLRLHALRAVAALDPGDEEMERLGAMARSFHEWLLGGSDRLVLAGPTFTEALEAMAGPAAEGSGHEGPAPDATPGETRPLEAQVGPAILGWPAKVGRDGEGPYIIFARPDSHASHASNGSTSKASDASTSPGDDGASGWPTSPAHLVFRPATLDADTGQMTFICTTECTVGFFIDVVENAKGIDWHAVDRLLNTHPGLRVVDDRRQGARVWDWHDRGGSGFTMRVADHWFADSRCGAPGGGTPTAAYPMQQVSPAAAMAVAHVAGCRLPMAHEWLAVYQPRAKEQLQSANLRGDAWASFAERIASDPHCDPPDAGIFSRSPSNAEDQSPPASAADPTAADDSTVDREVSVNGGAGWFRPAHHLSAAVSEPARAESPEMSFVNLVGNVAELVILSSEAAGSVTRYLDQQVMGMITANDSHVIIRLLGRDPDVLGVVGGSAIAQLVSPFGEPQPLRRHAGERHPPPPMQTFSDVGFRLAFSVEAAVAGVDGEDFQAATPGPAEPLPADMLLRALERAEYAAP